VRVKKAMILETLLGKRRGRRKKKTTEGNKQRMKKNSRKG
jgi:hypothetical protein